MVLRVDAGTKIPIGNAMLIAIFPIQGGKHENIGGGAGIHIGPKVHTVYQGAGHPEVLQVQIVSSGKIDAEPGKIVREAESFQIHQDCLPRYWP